MCEQKTKHVVSIGWLCQQFQRSYFDIMGAMAAAGVKPVMTIDLVPHYDFDDSFRALDPQGTAPMIRAEAAAHE
jgi:hypothetical protein